MHQKRRSVKEQPSQRFRLFGTVLNARMTWTGNGRFLASTAGQGSDIADRHVAEVGKTHGRRGDGEVGCGPSGRAPWLSTIQPLNRWACSGRRLKDTFIGLPTNTSGDADDAMKHCRCFCTHPSSTAICPVSRPGVCEHTAAGDRCITFRTAFSIQDTRARAEVMAQRHGKPRIDRLITGRCQGVSHRAVRGAAK